MSSNGASFLVPTSYSTLRSSQILGDLPTLNFGQPIEIPRVVGQQRILLVTSPTPGDAQVSIFSLKGGANSSVSPPFAILDSGGNAVLSYDHSIDYVVTEEIAAVSVAALPPPSNVRNARVNIFQINTLSGLNFLLKMSPFANIPSTIQLTGGVATDPVEMITEIRRAGRQQKGVGMILANAPFVSDTESYIITPSTAPSPIPLKRGRQLISVTYLNTPGEYFEFEVSALISGEYPGIVSPLGNALVQEGLFRCSIADISAISPLGRVERSGSFAVTDLTGRTWTFDFPSGLGVPLQFDVNGDASDPSPTIRLTGGPPYLGDLMVEVTKFDFF